MAKAPAGVDVASWDGSGAVWFKVCTHLFAVNDSVRERLEVSEGLSKSPHRPWLRRMRSIFSGASQARAAHLYRSTVERSSHYSVIASYSRDSRGEFGDVHIRLWRVVGIGAEI